MITAQDWARIEITSDYWLITVLLPAGRLAARLAAWPAGRLAGWPASRPAGRLAACLSVCLSGCLAGCLFAARCRRRPPAPALLPMQVWAETDDTGSYWPGWLLPRFEQKSQSRASNGPSRASNGPTWAKQGPVTASNDQYRAVTGSNGQ